jgi:hypothetical protein
METSHDPPRARATRVSARTDNWELGHFLTRFGVRRGVVERALRYLQMEHGPDLKRAAARSFKSRPPIVH